MSGAYRCDKCGQFRDGRPSDVMFRDGRDTQDDDDFGHTFVDLCPECAPSVLEPLKVIAATTHSAPVAEDEPNGSEMIPSFGKSLRGEEHTAEDDALWTSESDG